MQTERKAKALRGPCSFSCSVPALLAFNLKHFFVSFHVSLALRLVLARTAVTIMSDLISLPFTFFLRNVHYIICRTTYNLTSARIVTFVVSFSSCCLPACATWFPPRAIFSRSKIVVFLRRLCYHLPKIFLFQTVSHSTRFHLGPCFPLNLRAFISFSQFTDDLCLLFHIFAQVCLQSSLSLQSVDFNMFSHVIVFHKPVDTNGRIDCQSPEHTAVFEEFDKLGQQFITPGAVSVAPLHILQALGFITECY